MSEISVLKILEDTTVDGPGFRTSIYAAGCLHQCVGCHNPYSWDANNGTRMSIDEILEKIKSSEFSNVTFTGGDPLMQPLAFSELARRINRETDKTIWCYTGYRYEQVLASSKLSEILQYIDVLVDGRFVKSLHDESLRFKGSSNQRLVDVKKSLSVGKVIIWGNEMAINQQDYLPAGKYLFQKGAYTVCE